ncbi:hypothetical protein COL922a_011541 [Colletotrichum nupharicola]|nr:hypothetical protein COL922a_011541 [Colletotrichum nupharicola]
MEKVQLAVDLMPEDHLEQASTHRTLGLIYMLRGGATESLDDIKTAIALFTKSCATTSSAPRWRLQSAGKAIWLSMAYGDSNDAITLGREVMGLLPVLNTKDLTVSDRQDVLGEFEGIAMNVCAALLKCDKAKEALQFLEQGRAVLIRQLLDDRLDLSDLEMQDPDLVRRYQEIAKAIEEPISNIDDGDARETARRRRQESLRELDHLMRQISQIPGYAALFAGQTVEEMQQCAREGAIVIVNFTLMGYHAIIVTQNCVKAIDLSDTVDRSELVSWLMKRWTGRRSEMPGKNKDYLAYLAWIGNSCVKRILDEVRSVLDATADQLLRIWWIGSGTSSSIPFHAAGIHERDSTATAYHQTISSYTPSIKALSHARQRSRAAESGDSSLAILTMPKTPGGEGSLRLSNLPGVGEEEAAITKLVERHSHVEHLSQPSVAQTVECLRKHTIADFACHGTTDPHDPSQSALILQKSLNDGDTKVLVQDPLTMGELSKIELERVRLAYLSACSTAQSKSARLQDEVLHVVSGFIVAGFPHTVGCLWQSSDRVCISVAEAFYTELFRLHGNKWQDDDVARSLREAVM